ncbi:hypothetical protein AAMO2058_000795800 [Amorphochlora amoebiformis]
MIGGGKRKLTKRFVTGWATFWVLLGFSRQADGSHGQQISPPSISEPLHLGPSSHASFRCDHCGKYFLDQRKLVRHRSTATRRFKCTVCDRCFGQKTNLNRHLLTHKPKLYKCSNCNKTLANKYTLKRHRLIHFQMFECKDCGKSFRHNASYRRHILIHEDKYPFSCEECGKRFRQRFQRNRHRKLHTEGRLSKIYKFACPICANESESNVRFRRIEGLMSHILLAHKKTAHEASACLNSTPPVHRTSQYYTVPRTLMEEMLATPEPGGGGREISFGGGGDREIGFGGGEGREIDSWREEEDMKRTREEEAMKERERLRISEERRKKTAKKRENVGLNADRRCGHCGKTFEDRIQLSEHTLNAHSTAKIYQCETCSETFKYPTSLKRHILIHKDERPYPCKYCPRRFRQRSEKDTHEASIHRPGRIQHTCQSCKMSWAFKAEFEKHVSHVHGTATCHFCGMRMKSQRVLKAHISRRHGENYAYRCQFCSLRTNDKNEYELHRHKLYPCPSCNRNFTSITGFNVHQRCHTGMKPYACFVCRRRFNDVSNLRRHHSMHNYSRIFCMFCPFQTSGYHSIELHLRSFHPAHFHEVFLEGQVHVKSALSRTIVRSNPDPSANPNPNPNKWRSQWS